MSHANLSQQLIGKRQHQFMEKYIAILRGINVSGQKKIKMDDLRSLMEELKLKNVQTYIQSGNLVFEHSKVGEVELAKKIGEMLFQHYGFQVPVITRTLSEWKYVFDNNPFLNNRDEDISKLHVTFLSDNPQQEYLNKIKEYAYPPDEFIIAGKQVYLFCPDGYGITKLSNTFFENKLKVTATTRNFKTVSKLVEMASAL